MKSCLICDDHAILREAMVATICNGWPSAVIEEADNYLTAWEAAAQPFDLCISDLVMPGSEPVNGIARLRDLQPDMPLIILTGSHDDRMMMQLLAMGVDGFVPKSSSGPVIKAAIDLVLAGGRYLPPQVINQQILPEVSGKSLPTPSITGQQRKVIEFLAKGHTNKEIAQILGVAPSTVKFHVDGLLERLGVRNRAAIVNTAQELGLLRN